MDRAKRQRDHALTDAVSDGAGEDIIAFVNAKAAARA